MSNLAEKLPEPGLLRVTVDAKALHEALGSGVAGKGNVPILAFVRLEIVPSGGAYALRLTTTDMAVTVCQELAISVDSVGACCAEAALFRAALTGLDGAVVLEQTVDETLLVRAGRRRFSIPTRDADDFPGTEHLEPVNVDFNPLALREALNIVEYAAGRDDVRVYLDGVVLEQQTVAATNGKQLACATVVLGLPEGVRPIVPIRSLKRVTDALGEGTRMELLMRHRSPSSLRLTTGSSSVTAVLIDFQYPEWTRTVPVKEKADFVAELDPTAVKAALTRLMPFCEERGKVRVVEATSSADGLRFTAESGRAEDTLEVEVKGEVDLVIPIAQVIQILTKAGSAKVTWYGVNNGGAAHLFTIDGRADEHVIAAVRR